MRAFTIGFFLSLSWLIVVVCLAELCGCATIDDLFGPAERADVAHTADELEQCQEHGRACKADGGAHCYDTYCACVRDAGLSC